MNIKTKEIYSELYQILNLLGKEYIDKLPRKLFFMLEEKRDVNYNPKYRDDIPLDKQKIKKETISIMALLHLNYWCESENEKLELKQILKNNEDKYQEELKNKYNPDDIFKQHKEGRFFMFKIDGKYGNIQANGKSIDIEKTDVNELDKYLKELETKQGELIEEQNEYLSQIIS